MKAKLSKLFHEVFARRFSLVPASLLFVILACTVAASAGIFPNASGIANGITAMLFGSYESSATMASSSGIDFESFANGSPNGQGGWSATGAAPAGPGFDHQIVTNVSAPPSFGTKSLRMSNAVTSGSFGDQTYSSSLAEEAGETSAQNGGMSSGPRQNRYTAQWQFTSMVPGAVQPGLSVVASPDRGDGARMSWVQMTDTPTGISINFNDYQRGLGNTCGSGLNFVQTNVASGLARNAVHTLRIEMDFYDGVANDVVRVYINGALRHVGTSWEDYFRDCEGNPTRTVDSILFRTGGTAAPATLGNGFLIDNLNVNDNIGPASTTGVTTANPQNWIFFSEGGTGSGSFVGGPATAPLGTGSAQLIVDSDDRHAIGRLGNFGQRLDQITQLSYSSHQVSGNPAVAIALQLQVDYDVTDANNAFQGRLVYEPYQTPGNAVQQNTWQTWSALSGRWWATGAPGNSTCGQATPCTWGQLLTNWPNLGIHSSSVLGAIIFKAGGPVGSNFTGSVDNFTLGINGNNTTFDFDPTVNRMVDDDGIAADGNCGASDAASSSVSAAVAAANPGDTISVCPGTYANPNSIELNKANLTITSAEPTRAVLQTSSATTGSGMSNLFHVTATGVTLNNLEIQKTDIANQEITWYQGNNFTATNNLIYGPDPGSPWAVNNIISRAFVGSPGANNVNFTGNTIAHLRQPAYVDNATGGIIANNNVSGTRGWVVAQGAYSFTGNTWGEPQNQACDIALLPLVNPVDYPARLVMSQANDNAFICAQYPGGENGRALAYVDNTQSFNGSDNTPHMTIQDGINGALVGGEVQVASGDYPEDVNINKTVKVTGAGSGSTTITGPIGGSSGSTVAITASNIEISGFKITRAGNNTTDWNNPALNSAGISIQGLGITNALIHDNVFDGNRTGIDINNSNGHTVRNNVIDNNRTGMIFRNQTDNMTVLENFISNNWTVGVLFLDASGGTNSPVQTAAAGTFSNNSISGNWYGQIVDRQTGVSLPAPGANPKNFAGNWYGAAPPTITTANSAEPGYSAQIPVAYSGSAVPPGGQPDIAGPASANFVVSPHLGVGTDTNVETVPGRGTFGFQGDPSNLLGAVSISGNISPALDGVTVTLSGSMNAVAVTSGGGNYSFTGLLGGGNYLVTPSLAGYTFDPTSRSYTNVTTSITNANFNGFVGNSTRIVRMLNSYTTPGQNVTVPVELLSQGNENSVAFSINYDPLLVHSPLVTLGPDAAAGALIVNNSTAGQLGVAVALTPPTVFPAGTRHIVNVTFSTNLTAVANTPVTFGNTPTIRKVANANADPLPATFVNALIVFAQGLEGDVINRPTGDNLVDVADFTQVGRFVVGLDAVDPLYNEFQRTDVAPRPTKGDGLLDVTDFTQAGRYAVGLDATTSAGGPFVQSLFPFALSSAEKGEMAELAAPEGSVRTVRVVSVASSPAQQVIVSIEIDAQGNEAGVGFTMSYDQSILSNPVVAVGSGMPGAFMIPNTSTDPGRVGVVLTYISGNIVAGTRQIATITFNVSPTAAAGTYPLGLPGAPPTANSVSSVAPVTNLPATYTGGTLTILGPSAAKASAGGVVQGPEGRPLRSAFVTLTDETGETRTVRSNVFGYFRFDDLTVGRTYVLNARARGYTFAPTVVSLTDNVLDLRLVAEGRR